MGLSRKKVREISGYTFENEQVSVEGWLSRAEAFREAAIIINQSDNPKVQYAYFYNVAISLELLIKAVFLYKGKELTKNHKLNQLAKDIGLPVSKEQLDTLELLSEVVIWSGRYPTPNKVGHWDNYHDVIQNKHVIRDGKVVRACPKRFPTLENVNKIWEVCIGELVV